MSSLWNVRLEQRKQIELSVTARCPKKIYTAITSSNRQQSSFTDSKRKLSIFKLWLSRLRSDFRLPVTTQKIRCTKTSINIAREIKPRARCRKVCWHIIISINRHNKTTTTVNNERLSNIRAINSNNNDNCNQLTDMFNSSDHIVVLF